MEWNCAPRQRIHQHANEQRKDDQRPAVVSRVCVEEIEKLCHPGEGLAPQTMIGDVLQPSLFEKDEIDPPRVEHKTIDAALAWGKGQLPRRDPKDLSPLGVGAHPGANIFLGGIIGQP
jgi:hypothetical protein